MTVIETPPRISPAARWLGGFALAALPLVLVVLTYLAWRDRLPDPMPTHWGRGGRLDGTTSLAGLAATFIIMTVAGALVGAAGAALTRAGARTRRWLVTTGAGTGGFGVGTWLMLVTVALDAPDASHADMPTWQLAALLVGMFGWAGLAFLACPSPPPHPPAPPRRPPADLPRLDLPAGQRAAYSEVARPGNWAYAVLGLTFAVAAALALWATPWAALPMLLVVGIALLLQITRITVDSRGLRAGFGPWGWPRVTVPLAEILSAEVTTVRPREWGGWGYRARPDGSRGLILRRGPGVRLDLSGERRFVASVREPDTVAGLLNTLRDRGGASAHPPSGPRR